MSLLSMVQGAALRCNLKVPGQAYSSTDDNILQLVAFVQDSGRELVERADWNTLKRTFQVTGDGTTTLFPLPSDWMRLCPSDKSPVGALVSLARPTIPLRGPINDEALNQIKALTAFPAYPVWRLINKNLEIWPAIANGEVVRTSYFSKSFVQAISYVGPLPSQLTAVTTYQQSFQSDADTSLIEEDTLMKGAIWRWKRAKGLDYAEEFREYQLSIERNAGQQDSGRVITTSTITGVDDTFWPGQIGYTPP